MLPLKGLKVLDFSHAADGPTCGLMLAQAGADVIKIEPLQGEPYRRGADRRRLLQRQPQQARPGPQPAIRRGQRDSAHKLASAADIVVESFTPGVAERLGIGYAEIE